MSSPLKSGRCPNPNPNPNPNPLTSGRWNVVPCHSTRHAKGFICRMQHYNQSIVPAASDFVTLCDRQDGVQAVHNNTGHCCSLVSGKWGSGLESPFGNNVLGSPPCPGSIFGLTPAMTANGISYIRANGQCTVKLSYDRGTKCADEHGSCSCPYGKQVIYGAGTTWSKPKQMTSSSISCNNGVFGDPITGTIKRCLCLHESGQATLEGPGTWTGPFDFTDNAITGLEISCGEGASGGFVYHRGPKTFDEAERDCVNRGSHLATFQSIADVQAADAAATQAGATGSEREFWIGLHDKKKEGTWEWTSQRGLGYTNWGDGEPNDYGTGEDCAHARRDMKWNDNKCSSKRGYVCSKGKGAILPAPPPGSPPSPKPTVTATVALSGISASQFDTQAQLSFKNVIATKVAGCGTVAVPLPCTLLDVTIIAFGNIRRSAAALSVQFQVALRSEAIQTVAIAAVNNYVASPQFKADLVASGTNLAQVSGTVLVSPAAATTQPTSVKKFATSTPPLHSALNTSYVYIAEKKTWAQAEVCCSWEEFCIFYYNWLRLLFSPSFCGAVLLQ